MRPLRGGHFSPAVSIVTGGGSGIGRAIAAELVRRGGHVVLADIDEAAAHEAVDEFGPRSSAAVVDVTDAEALEALVADTVADHGSLDLMVNNAGAATVGPIEELTDRHWAKALDLNLGGVVNGVHAAYPVMRRQGRGTILNTASLAGLVAVPAMLPYTTTKHAVVGLSLGLRAEAAEHGIRVSVLCPGFVDTPLLDNPYEPPPSVGENPRERVHRMLPKLLTSEATARRAMRGLERNQAVIAVGAMAQLMWWANRVSPAGVVRVAGLTWARQRGRAADTTPPPAGDTLATPDREAP